MRELVARGAVEINLVAQDLTTYGTDLDGEIAARARWCAASARVDGLRWLRLHYAYPTATTDELLDVIAAEPRVAKYIDMPLQHIDDDMLKRMRRGHVGKTSRALVEQIRARIPGVTLRTAFIVGHPGETDAAFAQLVEFVERGRVRSRRRLQLLERGGHARGHARRRARMCRAEGRRERRRKLMRVAARHLAQAR